MSNVILTVASIDVRTAKTRYGDKPAYKVIGVDGTKVDFAFKKPQSIGVEVGGTYDIPVTTSKFGAELVKGAVPTILAAGSPGALTIASGPGVFVEPAVYQPTPVSKLTFPVDPTDVANIEIRKVALGAAVRFWENRAIAASVDEKAQQEDVIKTAYAFADYISGQREIKSLSDMASEADSPI